ncbi:hypothetical protein P8452_27561 [Trifolium repens]|nr:hypothetical protein P8452_27561 [Trifolium repens]
MEFSCSPCAHAHTTKQGGGVTPPGAIRNNLIFSTPARHGTWLSASRYGAVGKIGLHMEFSCSPCAHAHTTIQGGGVTPPGAIRNNLIFSTPARHGSWLSASRYGALSKIVLHMEILCSPSANSPTTIQGGGVTPPGAIRNTLILLSPARHGTWLSASRYGAVGKIGLHMEFSCSPCAHSPTTIQGGGVTPPGAIRNNLIFSSPARHVTWLSASRYGAVGKIGLHMEFSCSPCAHAQTTIKGGGVTPPGAIRNNLIFSTPARHGSWLSASRYGALSKIVLHMEILCSPSAHSPTTIQGGGVTPPGAIRNTLIFSSPARHGTWLSTSRYGAVGKIGLHMEFSCSPCAHSPTTIQGGGVTPPGAIRNNLIFSSPARHVTWFSASRYGVVGKIGQHMEFSCSPCAHAHTTIQGGGVTPPGAIRNNLIFSTPARHGTLLSASRYGAVGKIVLHMEFSCSPCAHSPTTIQGGWVTSPGAIRNNLIFSTPARHGTWLSASRYGAVGKIGLHMEFSCSPCAHSPTTIQGGGVTPPGAIRNTLIFSSAARHVTWFSASRYGAVGKIGQHMEFSCSPCAHAHTTIQGGGVQPPGAIRNNLIFSTPARHGTLLSASRYGVVGKIGLHMEFSCSPCAHAHTTIQGGGVTPPGAIQKTLIFSTPGRHGTWLSASRCGAVGKIVLHIEFSCSPCAHTHTTIQGGGVTPPGAIQKTLIFSTPARHATWFSASRCGAVGKIVLHIEFSCSPCAHAHTTIQGGGVTPPGAIRNNLIFSTPARHGSWLSASRYGALSKIVLHMEILCSPSAHSPTTIQGGGVTPPGAIRNTLIFSSPARHGTWLSTSRYGAVGKIGLHMEFSCSPCAHSPTTIQGGGVTPPGAIRNNLIFSSPARHVTWFSASRYGVVGKIGQHMEFSCSPCAHAHTTIQGGGVTPPGAIRNNLIFSTPARHGTLLSACWDRFLIFTVNSASRYGAVGKIVLHMEFSCSPCAHSPTTIQGGWVTSPGAIRNNLIFSTPARHGTWLSASRYGAVGKIGLHMEFSCSPCAHAHTTIQGGGVTPPGAIQKTNFFDLRSPWHVA